MKLRELLNLIKPFILKLNFWIDDNKTCPKGSNTLPKELNPVDTRNNLYVRSK